MIFYKDPRNKVHALELEGYEHLLPKGSVKITEEEAKALAAQPAQADLTPELTYIQKRAISYPPLTDYVDAVVKGDKEAVKAYIAACKAVKEKYPKP